MTCKRKKVTFIFSGFHNLDFLTGVKEFNQNFLAEYYFSLKFRLWPPGVFTPAGGPPCSAPCSQAPRQAQQKHRWEPSAPRTATAGWCRSGVRGQGSERAGAAPSPGLLLQLRAPAEGVDEGAVDAGDGQAQAEGQQLFAEGAAHTVLPLRQVHGQAQRGWTLTATATASLRWLSEKTSSIHSSNNKCILWLKVVD